MGLNMNPDRVRPNNLLRGKKLKTLSEPNAGRSTWSLFHSKNFFNKKESLKQVRKKKNKTRLPLSISPNTFNLSMRFTMKIEKTKPEKSTPSYSISRSINHSSLTPNVSH